MTIGHSGGESTAVVRVWPAATRRILWVALVILGLLTVAVTLVMGVPIAAPLGLLPVVLGLRSVGWAEVGEHRLSHRRLLGASESVSISDIREVGLGMRQVNGRKQWYPEVELRHGTSMKLSAFQSRSGKRTIASVEEVFAACVAQMPKAEADQFTTVTTSDDGELEFFLSPGYDAYLREKAEAPDTEVVAPIVAPEPDRSTPTASRQPHLTFCEPDDGLEADVESPEVFTPRALTDRRKQEGFTVVRDGFVERSGTDRRAAQAEGLPPVVIEQPVSAPRSAPERNTAQRFTSLFRRAT